MLLSDMEPTSTAIVAKGEDCRCVVRAENNAERVPPTPWYFAKEAVRC
jgi:hypothetical protein